MGTTVRIPDTDNQQTIDGIRQYVDDDHVATEDLVQIVARFNSTIRPIGLADRPIGFAEALRWAIALAEAEAIQSYVRNFGTVVRLPELGVIAEYSPSGDPTSVTRLIASRVVEFAPTDAALVTEELRRRVQLLEPGDVTVETGRFGRSELNWSLVSGLLRVSRRNSRMLLYALASGRASSWT